MYRINLKNIVPFKVLSQPFMYLKSSFNVLNQSFNMRCTPYILVHCALQDWHSILFKYFGGLNVFLAKVVPKNYLKRSFNKISI